jgi:hypothetical protein
MRWVPRHHATIHTHHQHPAAGSGAGVGQLSHWPHPGEGASPAARTGKAWTVGAAVAAAVAAAATVASYCDPVATTALHDGSPVVAALPAARGTLDERRLMGTDASNLSALAGARARTVSATL